MTQRFRVEKHLNMDGTATWHVLDATQGDVPAAEFNDEQQARAHADELARKESPTDDGDEAGDVPPTVP